MVLVGCLSACIQNRVGLCRNQVVMFPPPMLFLEKKKKKGLSKKIPLPLGYCVSVHIPKVVNRFSIFSFSPRAADDSRWKTTLSSDLSDALVCIRAFCLLRWFFFIYFLMKSKNQKTLPCLYGCFWNEFICWGMRRRWEHLLCGRYRGQRRGIKKPQPLFSPSAEQIAVVSLYVNLKHLAD